VRGGRRELCGDWDADVWFVEGMRFVCWCKARARVDWAECWVIAFIGL